MDQEEKVKCKVWQNGSQSARYDKMVVRVHQWSQMAESYFSSVPPFLFLRLCWLSTASSPLSRELTAGGENTGPPYISRCTRTWSSVRVYIKGHVWFTCQTAMETFPWYAQTAEVLHRNVQQNTEHQLAPPEVRTVTESSLNNASLTSVSGVSLSTSMKSRLKVFPWSMKACLRAPTGAFGTGTTYINNISSHPHI